MFTKAGCVKAAIVVLLFLGLVTAGIFLIMLHKPGTDEPPKPSLYESQIRVAINKRTVNLPLYALNDLIKGKSYEVVLVPVEDSDECWERLAAGSLDICISSLDTIALGLARHHPGAILFKVSNSGGEDAIVLKKSFASGEEIVGKKIAVVPGSSGYMLLTLFLDKLGRTIQECNLLYAPDQAHALDKLLSGRADAAMLGDPYLHDALSKNCKVLQMASSSPLIEDYCVVSEMMRNNHPERVREVVRAWFEILQIIERNPGLGKRLIGRGSGLPPELLSKFIERLEFTTLAENKSLREEELSSKIQKFQNLWSIMGESNAHLPIDLRRSIDLSYIREINEDEIKSFIIDEGETPSVTPILISPAPSPTNAAPSPTTTSSVPVTSSPSPTISSTPHPGSPEVLITPGESL